MSLHEESGEQHYVFKEPKSAAAGTRAPRLQDSVKLLSAFCSLPLYLRISKAVAQELR